MRLIRIIGILAFLPSPVPRQAARNPTSRPAQVNPGTTKNKNISPSTVTVKDQPSPASDQAKRNNPTLQSEPRHVVIDSSPGKDAWDKSYIVLTGILVLIGAVTVMAVWIQAQKTAESAKATADSVDAIKQQIGIMERQTKAGEDNAKAALLNTEVLISSERAWLLITPTLPKSASVGGPYEGLTFTWTIKNVGRTPARLIETDATAWKVKDIRTIPESPKYEGKPLALNKFPLVPNDSLGFGGLVEPVGDPFTREEIDAITKRELTLIAYGYVRYLDSFDREHTARFCQTYAIFSVGREGFGPYWDAPSTYTECT